MYSAASAPPPAAVAWRARVVLPLDRPPLDKGLVTAAAGRIVAVGENLSGRPPIDLGDVALVPGFVNAHTHLEFSGLTQPIGEPGLFFPQWIAAVVAHRRESAAREADPAAARRRAIEQGLAESHGAGVAAVGEIATAAGLASAYGARAAMAGVALYELLGLAPERADALLAAAAAHLAEPWPAHWRPGLSPHAPYTIGPDLLTRICALAARARAPLAMHLAESPEELELLRSHSGGLVQQLTELEAWRPGVVPRGLRPLDYLQILAGAERVLVIHGNYLVGEEIEFLARRRERMSVVYCPRTHAYFGHGAYPLAELLQAGAAVAIGTDSRASNPDLDLLAELRCVARRHPEVPPEVILRLGTLNGAAALGLADELGSIAPGKRAALAAVPISGDAADPCAAVLASEWPATPVAAP